MAEAKMNGEHGKIWNKMAENHIELIKEMGEIKEEISSIKTTVKLLPVAENKQKIELILYSRTCPDAVPRSIFVFILLEHWRINSITPSILFLVAEQLGSASSISIGTASDLRNCLIEAAVTD